VALTLQCLTKKRDFSDPTEAESLPVNPARVSIASAAFVEKWTRRIGAIGAMIVPLFVKRRDSRRNSPFSTWRNQERSYRWSALPSAWRSRRSLRESAIHPALSLHLIHAQAGRDLFPPRTLALNPREPSYRTIPPCRTRPRLRLKVASRAGSSCAPPQVLRNLWYPRNRR